MDIAYWFMCYMGFFTLFCHYRLHMITSPRHMVPLKMYHFQQISVHAVLDFNGRLIEKASC